MIRLTRTIEYEYETVEDLAKDVANWTLRPSPQWFAFGPTKRARSTIVAVVEVEAIPSQKCDCGHPKSHHLGQRNSINNAFCDHFICDCQGYTPAVPS